MTEDRTLRWGASEVTRLLKLCSNHNIEPPSLLRWSPASQPEEEEFLDVLYRCRNCSASDQRDKVYAILGLIQREMAAEVPVDYTQNARQIFTNLAFYLIIRRQRFDAVRHAVNQPINTEDYPSWVPQWDVKCVYEPLPAQFASRDINMLARSWYFQESSSSTALCREASPTHAPATHHEEKTGLAITPRSLHDAIPCLRVKAHLLGTVSRRLHTITRTSVVPREPLDAFCNTGACPRCLRETNLESLSAVEKAESFIRMHRNIFAKDTQSYGIGKRRFITGQSMGFMREWAAVNPLQIGDTVWALVGLRVPVILRKVEDHFVLIGECYLYRATLPHLCPHCGQEKKPWAMHTEVIDIW